MSIFNDKEIRKRLKANGLSDEEIEDAIKGKVASHVYGKMTTPLSPSAYRKNQRRKKQRLKDQVSR